MHKQLQSLYFVVRPISKCLGKPDESVVFLMVKDLNLCLNPRVNYSRKPLLTFVVRYAWYGHTQKEGKAWNVVVTKSTFVPLGRLFDGYSKRTQFPDLVKLYDVSPLLHFCTTTSQLEAIRKKTVEPCTAVHCL